MTPRKRSCPRRLLQHLDTDHGLAWDGPGPVPRVYGLEAAKLLPKRGIFRKGVAFQPRCGLRLPDPCQRRPECVFTNTRTNFIAASICTPGQCTIGTANVS